MAALKPAQIVAGDTWARAWALADGNDVPLDLNGASARLHVRDKAGALAMSADTTDGRLTISGSTISMIMPAAVTATLAPGAYRYAIEVTFSGGTVRTIEINTLAVQADLTYDQPVVP
jgi:hypothetical protein